MNLIQLTVKSFARIQIRAHFNENCAQIVYSSSQLVLLMRKKGFGLHALQQEVTSHDFLKIYLMNLIQRVMRFFDKLFC